MFQAEYTITQCGDTFKIQFKQESVLKSISNVLGTIQDNALVFRANSVKPIKHPSYDVSLKVIYYLTKQLEFLIKERKCFYKLNPDHLFIVNNSIVIYLSSEYLVDIKKDKIRISVPFLKEAFDSPELLELKTIPAELHYKTIYYTLANVVLYLLNVKLENLEGTKIYGLLKRCMHSVPEKRAVIYI